MSLDAPAAFISAADQGYAQAEQRLNDFLPLLVVEMGQGDTAVLWAASVLVMLKVQEADKLPPHLIEIWQAALYRLARQRQVVSEPAGPDLSTLPARVLYAARVVQELRQADDEFRTAYYSMGYNGSGLCGLLHDASDRLAR